MAPIFTGNKLGFGRVDAASGSSIPFSAASGGIVYYSPSTGKTYHVFLVGKHTLTTTSSISNVELLVIGGGGGAGSQHGGGGGAGGALHHTSLSLNASTNYSVTVGRGGAGAIHGRGPANGTATYGENGENSYFGPPVAPQGYTAYGGGGGFPLGRSGSSGETPLYYDRAPSSSAPYQGAGLPGGCGGGSGDEPGQPGGTSTQTPMNGATGYGNPGGKATGASTYDAAGGGGLGTAGDGTAGAGPSNGRGGDGRAFPSFAAPYFSSFMPSPWVSAVGPTGLFGGGGGKGSESGPNVGGAGGPGGGGAGADGGNPGTVGNPGVQHTGGGGGGSSGFYADGGYGGPGIIILAYTTPAPSASAGLMNVSSSGTSSIATYGNYTFYTYTSTGTFTVNTAAPDVIHPDGRPGNYISIVAVGGGGSGGHHHGAGGGGGGAVHATGPSGDGVIDLRPAAGAGAITVKVGAGGPGGGPWGNATTPGTPGQATRFGSSSNPYYVIAHGGGGGGSHSQPNFSANSSNRPFAFMSAWLVDDTAPPTFYTTANALWNPNVPGGGGSSFAGAGPRAGGCGGGAPFNQNQNPGAWPLSHGAERTDSNNYSGETGGVGTQMLAPGVSGSYGYGSPGRRVDAWGNPGSSTGGGGTNYAGRRENFTDISGRRGLDARQVPQAFYGPTHPHYNDQQRYGAGGGGQSDGGATDPGGTANPGSGGAGGGSSATGYGNGGGGARYFPGSAGNGSDGIIIIKVRSS